MDSLRTAFERNIVPLLQEYFFGDFGKIELVLGKGFIKAVENTEENIFAVAEDYDASEFSERIIYKFEDIDIMTNEDFKKAIKILLKK